MKIILFLTLISTFSFAKANEPEFTCMVTQTGYNYHFYLSEEKKVEVYTPSGNFVTKFDGIDVRYMSIESIPSYDQYTIYFTDDNTTLATIEFQEEDTVGDGKMHLGDGNSYSVNCFREEIWFPEN
ncbi:MAG: hypothetical protein H6621_08385 [Halobacteriovoraceae bacterium]|nr:hypothetical protein [Halobacteriovoraceae bacterium]